MIRLRWLCVCGVALAATMSRGQDAWIARAFIPSTNSVHGEVRLVRTEAGACFQTLLYSRHLRRGLHEMSREERLGWPEGYPCHADSTNYLDALARGRDRVFSSAPAGETNRIYRMLIECTLGTQDAICVVSEVDLEGDANELRIGNRRPVCEVPVHPFYASRAMRLMGEQGFGLAGEPLAELLRSAGWREVEPPVVPEAARVVPR